MTEQRPILIVGGGPTGMTIAMELSRLGVPVRIVEKSREVATTSRALAVQARTLELLEPRGVGKEMLRIGNEAPSVALYVDRKPAARIDLSRVPSRYNFILLLAQSETERLLREQLTRQGVTIERGKELVAFSQSDRGVRAVLRDDHGALEELDAAYAISAEGAHSTMRRTLGLEFEGREIPQAYVLADVHVDGALPDNDLSIFLAREGLLAVFPMGSRRFRLIVADPQTHPADAPPPSLEEVRELFDSRTSFPGTLHDLVWSSRFHINSRMLKKLHVGRVFFGGDSAHIHSPAGGQGMNTGIQDMINLGWKLAMVYRGEAKPALLDTYDEDRLPVIRGVVQKTELATETANSESFFVHQLIAHVAPLALGTDTVQRAGTAMLSQISAGYRDSSLSTTQHAHGHVHAGDRVPRALQHLVDPNGLTLFTRRTLAVGAWPIAKITDADIAVDEIWIVRPDCYIAFIGDAEGMHAWLARWLEPGIAQPRKTQPSGSQP